MLICSHQIFWTLVGQGALWDDIVASNILDSGGPRSLRSRYSRIKIFGLWWDGAYKRVWRCLSWVSCAPPTRQGWSWLLTARFFQNINKLELSRLRFEWFLQTFSKSQGEKNKFGVSSKITLKWHLLTSEWALSKKKSQALSNLAVLFYL